MAKAFKVKIKGVEKLRSNLAKVAKKYPGVANQVLFEEGEGLVEIAVPLTPIDVGTLRGSYFVNRPIRSGNRLKLTLGVGGAAKDYAVPVHERTEVSHPVGQAKFLEKAVKINRRGMLKRMRDSMAAKVAKIQLA